MYAKDAIVIRECASSGTQSPRLVGPFVGEVKSVETLMRHYTRIIVSFVAGKEIKQNAPHSLQRRRGARIRVLRNLSQVASDILS